MKNRNTILAATVAAAVLAATSLWAAQTRTVPLSDLTHVHGVVVDPEDGSRLLLATHHGVWRTLPDGRAEQVSDNADDYMGFTAHPKDPALFYGSGHPATGGNAGFLVSRDGARTWEQVSAGADGPVDFHAMTVSAADPNVIYGLYGGLQASRDGGRTWEVVGSPSGEVYDVAASATDVDTVYAATEAGPSVSSDGGRTWADAGAPRRPTSLVEVGKDGTVYAFVVGSGLLRLTVADEEWQRVSETSPDWIPLHLALHPDDPARLFAITTESRIMASEDGGGSWRQLG